MNLLMRESFWIGLAIIVMALAAILAGLQPYFESRAYNRLTGAHTTYWDAVWLELRVDASPQPDKH